MSYARFSNDSDVYVYHDIDFHLTCCGCGLHGRSSFNTECYDHMLAHLAEHEAKGDKVSVAVKNLLEEAHEDGGKVGDCCCP